MSSLKKFITVAFFAISIVFIQTGLSQDFSLSGKVVDFDGKPISGATVKLKKADKSTTTADDGSFTLTSKSTTPPTSINGIPHWLGQSNFADLRDGHLTIRLFENAPVSITVFSIGGKTLYNKKNLFNAGIHTVSIPVTGKGVYLLRVKDERQEVTFKACSFEADIRGSALAYRDYSTRTSAKQATASAFSDILKASNTGYLNYQTWVTKAERSDLVLRMAKSDFPKVTKGYVTKPSVKVVHSSSILELEDGTLLATYYGGSAEGAKDVKEWVVRKPVGEEWGTPVHVADGKFEGGSWTCNNPILFQPRGGDVILYYHPVNGWYWTGRFKTSSDGGVTWSEMKNFGDDKFIGPAKNKPIQLDDGTIISGTSTENNEKTGAKWRVHVELSTDNAKTWERLPQLGPKNISAIQPTLMVYPENRIQMMCRTHDGTHNRISEAWSEDGGKTWSELTKSVLPNNNSGLDAVTLHDGTQLLAYNHTTRNQGGMGSKGRGFLTLAVSKNGKDWSAALILYHTSGGRYSYPAIIQARNGLVHVTSTQSRGKITHDVINPALLTETVPMPDGKWPQDGPLSLKAFKGSQ